MELYALDTDFKLHARKCDPAVLALPPDELVAHASATFGVSVRLVLVGQLDRAILGYQPTPRVHILPKETGR